MYRVVCSAEARERWCCNAYAAECRIAHQVKTRQNKAKADGTQTTKKKLSSKNQQQRRQRQKFEDSPLTESRSHRLSICSDPSRGTTGDGHRQIALLVINTGDLPSCQLN
ncbi:predicted protein [Histoplasma capsulatum var. duboisii H88]|uniref:Predicted protein n=1 Tax=Ajellomyces capsulatus (strain H88) TaxID=544711 RepID=F0U5G5_AJEC8|nr:predicted protein [Histoplasma capsulatum var. duboisii H88]